MTCSVYHLFSVPQRLSHFSLRYIFSDLNSECTQKRRNSYFVHLKCLLRPHLTRTSYANKILIKLSNIEHLTQNITQPTNALIVCHLF